MTNIAVFASGNGSNFEVLVQALGANIRFLFTDHHDAYVLKRAERLGIQAFVLERQDFPSKTAFELAIVDLLKQHQIDLVCLAGYMRFIGKTIFDHYSGLMVNLHPSLLPAFAGSPHAIDESWQAKAGLGITVHFVDEGIDTGAIIQQMPVAYHEQLADYEAALHAAEHQLYPAVVQKLIKQISDNA